MRAATTAAVAALLAAGGACPLLAAGGTGPKSVALVLDTSRSMIENDPQRYTSEISQIVSDLLSDGDELTVVRMPKDGFFYTPDCSEGVTPALARTSAGADRLGFKRSLDALVRYDTGTFFAAPIRTAIAALRRHPDRPRLLLVVADSGGLGDCETALTRELSALERDGATLAAINLGGDAGAFDRNPAFGLTASARDAEELIAAVARVYQRFLGGRQVATGNARGKVQVEIAPAVREAFLVFAADGPLGVVSEAAGNPGAHTVDLDFRGGGGAQGLDGRQREYRIVRLQRPNAGRWTFEASGLTSQAGWMLIQDSAVGVRLVSSPTVTAGMAATIEAQLVDEETGAAITDSSFLQGLGMTAQIEGRNVTLRDDGQGGDRLAGDGIFSTAVEMNRLGQHEIPVHLASSLLDRDRTLGLEVAASSWELRVSSPAVAEAGSPVELAVETVPIGRAEALKAPERIDVTAAGQVVQLTSSPARKGLYTGSWVPAEPGTVTLEYQPVGGSAALPVSATMTVNSVLKLGPAQPVTLVPVQAHGEATGELALARATVHGTFVLEASSDFARRRALLEIDPGSGWVALGATPVPLELGSGRPAIWRLRLRAAACPEPASAGDPFVIHLVQRGGSARLSIPLAVVIEPEPWWICWWPVLALALAGLAAAVVIHGFVSPSRFAPRLGVLLSPELDLGEGFFHPIRGTRGSGSGFYRDATVFVCGDYRLSGRTDGAVARLRADGRGVRIRTVPGATLLRQNADGGWEALPEEETSLRLGALYRNDLATLFFEVRHG